MASLGSIVVIAVALLGAPAAEPQPDVSLGVGWTVAQVRASLDAPPGPAPPPAAPDRDRTLAQTQPAATPEPDPGTPVSPPPPRVNVRPYAHHSDVDARIKEARRARALQVGGALAVQGAMVIYGITRGLDNAKEAEMMRDEPPPSQFKPMYPR
jgi:hypothetical protein